MSDAPTDFGPVADAGLEAAKEAEAAPQAPPQESAGQKILHGLADVGEVAAEIGIGGLILASEAGNPEGADALRDQQFKMEHHRK